MLKVKLEKVYFPLCFMKEKKILGSELTRTFLKVFNFYYETHNTQHSVKVSLRSRLERVLFGPGIHGASV